MPCCRMQYIAVAVQYIVAACNILLLHSNSLRFKGFSKWECGRNTISAKKITDLTWCRFNLFDLLLNCNACNLMRFLNFFELEKNRNGDKFFRGTFFLLLQISFWSFFETTIHQPTHRRQPTTHRRHHILSHTNTCSHNQTQPNTNKHKHTTHFQHRYRPTSFQVACQDIS